MQKRNILIRFVVVVLSCTILVLSGCGSNEQKPVTLSGKLTYAGDTPVPAKSSARISMVERGEDGANNRIVAERSLHQIGQKPITFDIDVARDLIDPDSQYGLRAEIIAGDGNVRWVSKQPVPVKPLQRDKPISIKLEPTMTEPELTFSKYRCADGFHLSAANSKEKAVVRLGNRRLVLKPTKKAHVKQYKDDHGNTLQMNDQGLAFHVDGEEHPQCQIVADQTPDTAGENDATATKPKKTANAVAASSTSENVTSEIPQGASKGGDE